MLIRYTASTGAAGLTTLGLLVLMSRLIDSGEPVLVESRRVEWLPFVVERTPPAPVQRRERAPKPPAPTDPPEVPRTRVTGSSGHGVTVKRPQAPPAEPGGPTRSGPMSDGDLLPVVKVAPNYPPVAIRRGLEGYVIVEYTVTGRGGVDDIRVVESSNAAFDRAAIDAVARFRYRPRVVNGRPVSVAGVKSLIRFELDGRR